MLKPTLFYSFTLDICLLVFCVFVISSIHGKHLSVTLDQNNPIMQASMGLTTPSRTSKAAPPSNANANAREPLFKDPKTNPVNGSGHQKSQIDILNAHGSTAKAGGKHINKTTDGKTTNVQQEHTDKAMLFLEYDIEPTATVTAIRTRSGKVIFTDPVRTTKNVSVDPQQHLSGTSELKESHILKLALDKLRSLYGRSSSRRKGKKREQHNPLSRRRSGKSARNKHGVAKSDAVLFNSPIHFKTDNNNRKLNSMIEHPGGLESFRQLLRLQHSKRTTISPVVYNVIFNALSEVIPNPLPTQPSKRYIHKKHEGISSSSQQVKPRHTVAIVPRTTGNLFNIHKHNVKTNVRTENKKQRRILNKNQLTPAEPKYSKLVSKTTNTPFSPKSSPSHDIHIPEYEILPEDPKTSHPVTRQVQRLSTTGNLVTFNVETNTDQASSTGQGHGISARREHPKKMSQESPNSKEINLQIGKIGVLNGNINVPTGKIKQLFDNVGGAVSGIRKQTERSGLIGDLISNVETAPGISAAYVKNEHVRSPSTAGKLSQTTTNRGTVTQSNRESGGQINRKDMVSVVSKPMLQRIQRYNSAGKVVTFDVETSQGTDSYQNNGNINRNVFENPMTLRQSQAPITTLHSRQQKTITRYTSSGHPVMFNVETSAPNTWPTGQPKIGIKSPTSNLETLISSHDGASKAADQVSNSPFMDTRILEHPAAQHSDGSTTIFSTSSKTQDFKTLSEKASSTKTQRSKQSVQQTSMGSKKVRQKLAKNRPGMTYRNIQSKRHQHTVGSDNIQSALLNKAKQVRHGVMTSQPTQYDQHIHTPQTSTTKSTSSIPNHLKKSSLAEKMARLHTVLHSIMDELQHPDMAFNQKNKAVQSAEKLTAELSKTLLGTKAFDQTSNTKNVPFMETNQQIQKLKTHILHNHPLPVKSLKPKETQQITQLPSQQQTNPEPQLQYQPKHTQIDRQNMQKHQHKIPQQHQQSQQQPPQQSQRKFQEQQINLKQQQQHNNQHKQVQLLRKTLYQIEQQNKNQNQQHHSQQQQRKQQQIINPARQYNQPHEHNQKQLRDVNNQINQQRLLQQQLHRVDRPDQQQQKLLASSSKQHLLTGYSGNTRNNIDRHTLPATEITFHIPPTGHGNVQMQIKGHIGNISYRD